MSEIPRVQALLKENLSLTSGVSKIHNQNNVHVLRKCLFHLVYNVNT